MDFPGLDVKKMSDDELFKRASELQGKLAYAFNSGSQGMVDQIQWMLETIQFEQSDRQSKKMWEQSAKRQPQIIESDPGLVDKKNEYETFKKKSPGTQTGGGGSLLKKSKSSTAGNLDI